MSLSFLVPLFLLGLAGLIVPLLVHMTRRRRRRVVAFPSLMFLQRIPFEEQRRHRIRNWFLFLVRALALALIVVAFARPFVTEGDAASGTAGGPEEVVILLDRSYSMAYGARWSRAVAAAHEAIDALGPLDRLSVVAFSEDARVLARSTSDRARLSAAVDTLRPGWGVTRLGPALKAAQTILETSDLPGRRVMIASDFQRNGWSGGEDVSLPPGTVVAPVAVGDPVSENLQVSLVTLSRQGPPGRERVTVAARVVRIGGHDARVAPVTLEVDGQEVQTRQIRLAPGAAGGVRFAPFTLSRPHTRGSVRVPPDALPADDARYFTLSPEAAVSVLVVDRSAGQRQGSLYLERALAISRQVPFDVHVRRNALPTADDLSAYDVIILDDVRLDGPGAAALETFARRGGGVLFMPGERGSWPPSAASSLPARPGPVEDRGEDLGSRLGRLDYDHPVFEIFAGPHSGDFAGARFYRVRALRTTDSARVLARFDDGSVALAEHRIGRGVVMIWASTLDAYWNDLALQPVYLPFIHSLVGYLSGRTAALPWLSVGQVVDLADGDALARAGLASPRAAGLDAPGALVALTPSGRSIPLGTVDGARYLTLEEAGFYTVRRAGSIPARPFVLAANVDVTESDTARMDPLELVAQVAPRDRVVEPRAGNDAQRLSTEDRERRQSLWRWILLGAFGLLLLETVISNRASRRRAGIPPLSA